MPISFHQADLKFRLQETAAIKLFIENRVKKEVGKAITLNYIFCSDKFLLDINRRFLNHDFYTDIITFPMEENTKGITAEIYISVDRVRENAMEQQTTFKHEMQRVIFHGVLHLIGYKDKTKRAEKAMRAKENEWIELFNAKRGKIA
jgi:probable rRNA maturation factor